MFTIDFNTISFVLAITSILIGIFAIWQASEYKKESSSLNELTRGMLEDIKIHSTVISQYAIPELKAYGESLRKHIFEEKTLKAAQTIDIKGTTSETLEQKNISSDLLNEINFLSKNIGKTTSVELFDRLKHKYDFSSILQEILIMNKNGVITWENSPSPPEALSEIKIV